MSPRHLSLLLSFSPPTAHTLSHTLLSQTLTHTPPTHTPQPGWWNASVLDPGDKTFQEEDRAQRTMGQLMHYTLPAATRTNCINCTSFDYTGMHPHPWTYVEPDIDSTNCHIGTNGTNGHNGGNGNLNSELHGKLNYDTTSPWGFSSLNYGRGG